MIRVFVGRTCQKVCFLTLELIFCFPSEAHKDERKIIYKIFTSIYKPKPYYCDLTFIHVRRFYNHIVRIVCHILSCFLSFLLSFFSLSLSFFLYFFLTISSHAKGNINCMCQNLLVSCFPLLRIMYQIFSFFLSFFLSNLNKPR